MLARALRTALRFLYAAYLATLSATLFLLAEIALYGYVWWSWIASAGFALLGCVAAYIFYLVVEGKL